MDSHANRRGMRGNRPNRDDAFFRDLPVGEGSLMQMLTPLGVAIGSVWFYQEHFSLFESVGAVLILGGTMIPAIRQQVRLRES